MEKIVNNPGLQHLAEKVFINLNVEDLKMCARINQSCEQILENPMFWLRIFGDILSKEDQNEWIKIIQSLEENSKKRKAIIPYLQGFVSIKQKTKIKQEMKEFYMKIIMLLLKSNWKT